MFERLTPRSRRLFTEARRVAEGLGWDFIDAHCLFVAFLNVDTWCLRSLLGDELAVTQLRDDLQRIPKRSRRRPTNGALPFTPDSKRTLEAAMSVAAEMGHDFLVPEHFLVGAIRNLAPVALAVCTRHGVAEERVRQHLKDHQLTL